MKDYEEKVLNIMDNAKDNIRTQFDKAYKSGYEDAKSKLWRDATDFAHEERDRGYRQGLEDAWEAAKKIHDGQISYEVFGLDKTGNGISYASPLNWGETITAQEAIFKIKEFENKKKQDIIHVGDEVVIDDKGRKAVVSRVLDNGLYNIMFYNGDTNCVDRCFIAKTGRHFDQIAEVLAEMRGEK